MPGQTHNLPKRSKLSSTAGKKPSSKGKPSQESRPSRREVSAGGIVFKRTKKGVVFAMIMDGFGKMTFTKGHVRRGEKLSDTALRETCEEVGLCDGKIITKLGKIDIWFVDRFLHKGALIHKDIHYYLIEVPSDSKMRIPKPKKKGERIKKGVWVPFDKVLEKSDYDDMEKIIKKALKLVKKML